MNASIARCYDSPRPRALPSPDRSVIRPRPKSYTILAHGTQRAHGRVIAAFAANAESGRRSGDAQRVSCRLGARDPAKDGASHQSRAAGVVVTEQAAYHVVPGFRHSLPPEPGIARGTNTRASVAAMQATSYPRGCKAGGATTGRGAAPRQAGRKKGADVCARPHRPAPEVRPPGMVS